MAEWVLAENGGDKARYRKKSILEPMFLKPEVDQFYIGLEEQIFSFLAQLFKDL